MTQKWDVVIIGAGLAGYVAANYLAKTDLSILIVEKRKHVGGRAKTNKMKQQYFNLGPHALYKKGKAMLLLEELGIKLSGKSPQLTGDLMENTMKHAAPLSPSGLFATSYLNWKQRLEWLLILMKVVRMDSEKLPDQTFQQWVKQNELSPKVSSLLYLLARLATYCHAPEVVSAKIMLSHLKTVMSGVLYINGGWQTIIDQLHNKAVISGIQLRTQTVVKQIASFAHRNDITLQLANNEEIITKNVICTTSPYELNQMLGKNQNSFFAQITPIKGATLDVALSELPNSKRLFALGITDPYYYAVHSHYAQLSANGNSTVLHVFKYHSPATHIDGKRVKNELEQFLERLQPGWKQYVITQRFLPNITVNQRLPKIGDEQKLQHAKKEIPGLYIAGDWASPDSILAEGAITSAQQAANEIINE